MLLSDYLTSIKRLKMKFKVGDKVKVTKELLLYLPNLADVVKGGGEIDYIYKDEASVNFYSGHHYHIYYHSLELLKNHQYVFDFMT